MSEQKLEFAIYENCQASALAEQIQAQLALGWELHGTLSVTTKFVSVERQGTHRRYVNHYTQAMVKKGKAKGFPNPLSSHLSPQ
jgi:hypothetical protein